MSPIPNPNRLLLQSTILQGLRGSTSLPLRPMLFPTPGLYLFSLTHYSRCALPWAGISELHCRGHCLQRLAV